MHPIIPIKSKITLNIIRIMRNNNCFFKALICSLLLLSISMKAQKPTLTYAGNEPKVQNPLSPEDSQKHIQVPDGFETVLFAAEPNIINPIAFSWDERGRLWVLQSTDYPHGLANDVGGDRITICEDTNNDGKADTFIDFATEQSLSTGITIVKGGAIVAQAPEMVFLQDTNGDDKMDKRTVLFDGFGTFDTHAGPSNLHYGPDNMIWGSVGYSGFENTFNEKDVKFTMGVYRFSKKGDFIEPIGRFNNNTWGMGIGEDFEIFGSTANNNHCCYVGIPLRHYNYLNDTKKRPSWAINSDFIQGHYDITAVAENPLQQVDVRGGYTAAAGANLYTARNFPQKYWGQMLVCEPTGHIVHLANIKEKGAGYEEVDGGNLFASTDEWTAPVFAETGPDGNVWIADWYNPVIQHNPDKRGMDNQIWNANKGKGNAHLNPLRDKGHGRIYIVRIKNSKKSNINSLANAGSNQLIKALKSDNMFWRTTAQRLIVEGGKKELISQLKELVSNKNTNGQGFNGAAMHALYTLDGLNSLDEALLLKGLKSNSPAVQKAALSLLPSSSKSSNEIVSSNLLKSTNLHVRLSALLRASEFPETLELSNAIEEISKIEENQNDKWLVAALNIYARKQNVDIVNPNAVEMIIPSAEEEILEWRYTTTKPTKNWASEDFDDSQWSIGTGVFGNGDVIRNQLKTKWKTSDIWLRRVAQLEGPLSEPILKIIHDDNAKVFVNGELVRDVRGSSSIYKYVKLDKESEKLFKKGKNTIAIHCNNRGGNQYVDAGIGVAGELKPDAVLHVNTVSQKMEFDKKELHVTTGQFVEIKLTNKDQMPHNLVLIDQGSLEDFGTLVDGYLSNPKAASTGYIPKSRYVIGATEMIDPNGIGSFYFKAPDKPGRYPFICTFPGHWRMMQGVLIVEAKGTYTSINKEATKILSVGVGGSHDFLKYFGIADGKILSDNGKNSVEFTGDIDAFGEKIESADVLLLTNNKPYTESVKETVLKHANNGKGMLILHPSTWYNWKDWPIYNKTLVGGGSESHEKLQEFEVKVIRPNHPIMKGIPPNFRIIDELYRWKKDPKGTDIEVLAVGRGLESGEEFPVVWVVKHPKANIVGNTLGHDDRAHSLAPYQQILLNSLHWILK